MLDDQFGGSPTDDLTSGPDNINADRSASMYRRILLIVAIVVCLILGIYFRHFHRLPTEDILAANLARQSAAAAEDSNDDSVADNPTKRSRRDWDQWIRRNRFVSIGKLFDKCDGEDRIMLGRVVMLEDHEKGGVKSRTYLNVTLHEDVVGGCMYLTCQYNGNDLYSNHWDLCTVEEGQDDRVINCPIRVGRRKFVKELKIPNYLPKGRYTTKAWVLDQNKQMIGCAFAEFTL